LAKILERELVIDETVSLPFKVFKEARLSWRISLNKNGAILRLPIHFSSIDIENKIKWSRKWISDQLSSKPQLQNNFTNHTFKTGDTIKIIGKVYILQINTIADSTRFSAKISDNVIKINAPKLDNLSFNKTTSKLLSRVAAKISHNYIHQRVSELNNEYFNKNISKITFKYNSSNWGSCSSKSNINLSTRLMLAPLEVIDYVIIHELSHLIHMNHSAQFWAVVQKAMPNYQIHEKWLKDNSHICDFKPQLPKN
jgi:predicted metal-dependent hydrolase